MLCARQSNDPLIVVSIENDDIVNELDLADYDCSSENIRLVRSAIENNGEIKLMRNAMVECARERIRDTIDALRNELTIDGFTVLEKYPVCPMCGEHIKEGFFDPGFWGPSRIGGHICEKCFARYMNITFGLYKWKTVLDDNVGGFYEYQNADGEWYGTGIYYTTWHGWPETLGSYTHRANSHHC